jgi:hypothetical protein
LSNENKNDIKQKSYSQNDYKRIKDAIISTNQINIKQYLDLVAMPDINKHSNLGTGLGTGLGNIISETYLPNMNLYMEKNMDNLEMKTINKLIENIPKLSIMNFLKDYMKKIKETYNQIFNNLSTQTSSEHKKNGISDVSGVSGVSGVSSVSSVSGGAKQQPFNIHRHLSTLTSQIEIEINSLVKKITTDKLAYKYNNILSTLGYFKKLYDEFKANMVNANNRDNGNSKYSDDSGISGNSDNSGNSMRGDRYTQDDIDNKSDIFRYNKKEESIQGYIKYLNDIINQIKNQKLVNPLNKDKIRPHFRNFLQYGENIKLFNALDKTTREIYNFARLFKSKHRYKVLFPEMVSSILHYLLVISLVNLFDVIDNNKMQKGQTDIIDFKFKQPIEQDSALLDYSKVMDINLMNEDTPLDDDGQPIDLLESFEFKNSNNLKVVGGFIITYLDYIIESQGTYDELTNEYINIVVTKDKQKEIENTLRSFEWLNLEQNSDIYKLTLMKMRLKKVNYSNLTPYLKQQYGDNFGNDVNNENNGNDENDAHNLNTNDNDNYNETYQEDDEREGDGGVSVGDDIGYDDDNDNNDNIERNAYGMDKYELENELPNIFNVDDMDEAEMDYDYIGVTEND